MSRTIKDFSRREMKVICEEYANSEWKISGTQFCEKYDVTSSVFYAILKKSVIESIVSDDVVKKMSIRAAQNTTRYGGQGAYINTMNAYDKYIEQRKTFEFSPRDKIFYVIEYANSQMNSHEFMDKYCIERKLFERTMASAIVECLVNDDVVNILEYKAMQFNNSSVSKNFFEQLRTRRSEYKFSHIGCKGESSKSTSKSRGLKNKKKIKLKKMQHLEFIEKEKKFYGIPDEMDEYEASIANSYLKKDDDVY